jgi:hypothetical protein
MPSTESRTWRVGTAGLITKMPKAARPFLASSVPSIFD